MPGVHLQISPVNYAPPQFFSALGVQPPSYVYDFMADARMSCFFNKLAKSFIWLQRAILCSGYNSPCMASPAGQTNQRGLGLSGSIHEEAHLGLS